jgi:diaminopimelate epimerase
MPQIPFIKMHGLGNDFIVFDGLISSRDEFRLQVKALTPRFVRKICDRRLGIGADQILWIKPAKSKKAVARMEVINSDGSSAEMCGNGIRAVALYLHSSKKGLSGKAGHKKSTQIYPIETDSGVLDVEVSGSHARVDMGRPQIAKRSESLRIDGRSLSFWEVSMGNPHAVIILDAKKGDDLENYPVEGEGAIIEVHPRFPKRTNVEYVQVNSSSKITVRVWERGAGITLACGTGACASAVAAIQAGRAKSPVEVHLPGGVLKIEWSGDPRHSVFMTGPAEEVFRGEISASL